MKERMTPIWFKELDSTNNEAIRGIENYDNLSVLAARKQFAGRGQRGNRWDAEPGANLTFSIVLKFRSEGMTPLPASRQFRLSRIAALAVCDYLKAKGVESRIKWPNDIYVRDRKICVMLIENSLDGKDVDWSVIGIGINLNQKKFPVEVINPTSLTLLTGAQYDVVAELDLFYSCFLQRFRESDARLQTDYERILYRKDERHPFTDCATGTVFQGIIRGINEDARLVVELNDGSSRTFAFKEISYII